MSNDLTRNCMEELLTKAPWLPERWDDETDVVVVGYGGAGAIAAIHTRYLGGSCIVLEKSSFADGGNTAVSGGHIHTACAVNVDEWLEICRHGSHGATPVETLRPALEHAQDTPLWLQEYGMNLIWTDEYNDGHRRPSEYQNGFVSGREKITGPYLFDELHETATEKYGVDVRLSHRVLELIQNPLTKEILGVRAATPEGDKYFKARKAVLLCCGGYENSVGLQNNHNYPGVRFFPWGTPNNTGDGIRAAEAIGARIWHMASVESSSLGFMIPSQMANCSISTDATDGIRPYNYIIVDFDGNRFFKEDKTGAHAHDHHPGLDVNTRTFDYEHLPMFLVFDKHMFEAGPLWRGTGRAGIVNTYAGVWSERNPDNPVFDWGKDNQRGLKEGWIFKGDTIEELAANIKGERPCNTPSEAIRGISGENLRKSIQRWNELCANGEDTDFNRDPSHMLPINENEGPYYAVELCFSCINTQGGPAKNEFCQTLTPFDKVIPRLYNCGECGSFNGFLYTYGNILEALTTGRVAADHALKLDAWDSPSARIPGQQKSEYDNELTPVPGGLELKMVDKSAEEQAAIAEGKTCKFTGKYYASLEEAVDKANNHGGGTVILIADTVVSKNGHVPDMCFNSGFAIRSKKGGPRFRIYRGAQDKKEMLQITDGTLRLYDVILDGTCEGAAERAAIRVSDLGKAFLSNVIIENNHSNNANNVENQGASAICCVGDKTLLKLDSRSLIRNCKGSGSVLSAVVASGGKVINEGISFENNKTTRSGNPNYLDLTGTTNFEGEPIEYESETVEYEEEESAE